MYCKYCMTPARCIIHCSSTCCPALPSHL
jgi:hypothetical protein